MDPGRPFLDEEPQNNIQNTFRIFKIFLYRICHSKDIFRQDFYPWLPVKYKVFGVREKGGCFFRKMLLLSHARSLHSSRALSSTQPPAPLNLIIRLLTLARANSLFNCLGLVGSFAPESRATPDYFFRILLKLISARICWIQVGF